MKKKYRFMVTSALFLLLCVSAAFCKDQTAFVDHQDRSIGKPVPQWVIDAFNGNVVAAQKSLGLAKNTKLFLLSGKGDVLEFCRTWAELVDVPTELLFNAVRVAQSELRADISLKETEKQQIEESLLTSLSMMTVAGIEKRTSYWVKALVGNQEQYTYFVVYTVPVDMWQKQIRAALPAVEVMPEKFQKKIMTELSKPSVLSN